MQSWSWTTQIPLPGTYCPVAGTSSTCQLVQSWSQGKRPASPELMLSPGQPASADWQPRVVRTWMSWPNMRHFYKWFSSEPLLVRPRSPQPTVQLFFLWPIHSFLFSHYFMLILNKHLTRQTSSQYLLPEALTYDTAWPCCQWGAALGLQ